KKKALLYNFVSALMAIAGAITGYFIADSAGGFSAFILSLSAGGFIYIATSDLIPQLHKESNLKRSSFAFIAFLLGIALMALLKALDH
ncbi:MAG: ZIP family metal transporter, partial [Candidatus Omnitrophica bacterium]|nr:ZIP family metal transporter [Candidatus Omnitrophota bacterium]